MLVDLLLATGREPRFHGNGFTQLYLSENCRLHVWHPMLQRIPGHNAAIHDHVYDMRSTVLHGELTQVTYELGHGSRFVDVWRIGVAGTEPGGRRSSSPAFAVVGMDRIRETGRYQIGAMRSYTFSRDCLHDSETHPSAVVVTLFERIPRPDDREQPRIVCAVGELPMNAFAQETQPAPDTMWAVIRASLTLVGELGQSMIEEQIT